MLTSMPPTQQQFPTLQPFASAIRLSAAFFLLTAALLIGVSLWQPHIGWGYFRDEMYYLMCGRHLAFGYVDQGPIVGLQARTAELVFGRSLAGIRIFSALADAFAVGLTGILCWAFGGGRGAQALAMTAVMLAPQWLAEGSYLSMNSFEAPFWGLCVLAVVMLLRGDTGRWWFLFGAAAGMGVENKPSMTFFLVALLAGLLLTPARRILFTRECAIGVALLLCLAAPNILWQTTHHWPTMEFLHNGRVENKNTKLAPPQFLLQQALMLSPFSVVLWVAGVIVALVRREWRWLGFTYIIFLAIMMTLHAKDYYLAAIYPALFALGCAARWNGTPQGANFYARWRHPVYATLLVVTGLLILPAAIPVFKVDEQIAYLHRMHLDPKQSENEKTGILPQFFADRFGWQEEVEKVASIYNSLPPADKAACGIFGSNYGETSALNWLVSPEPIPVAVSGHNAYWMWGPNGYSGDCMIEVVGASPEEMREIYSEVSIAGKLDNPYSMPYERRNIYLVHHRRGNFTQAWGEMKSYI